MATAKAGDTVRVRYSGKLDDGSTFDASAKEAPLEFTLGKGTTLDGFEKAVTGMEVGEKKHVCVPPAEGYGPRKENMRIPISRSQLPPALVLSVGQQLQHVRSNGQRDILTVLELNESTVVLDSNHPLAGQQLNFDIELVEIVSIF
jgi:peptidylprolyl isomerase